MNRIRNVYLQPQKQPNSPKCPKLHKAVCHTYATKAYEASGFRAHPLNCHLLNPSNSSKESNASNLTYERNARNGLKIKALIHNAAKNLNLNLTYLCVGEIHQRMRFPSEKPKKIESRNKTHNTVTNVTRATSGPRR